MHLYFNLNNPAIYSTRFEIYLFAVLDKKCSSLLLASNFGISIMSPLTLTLVESAKMILYLSPNKYKYSFPSKTMEYLASGTPTLLYRLPGIPDEYFNYCFVVDGLGIKALQVKIEEVLNLSHEDLELTGKRARDFILKQKNPIQQCKKIFQLIQK